MPSLRGHADHILGLIVEETWDVSEAIEELERRRGKLRDTVLDLCRARGASRWTHPRGAIRVERYASYKVKRAGEVLDVLRTLGWEDRVLDVDGRALHALAKERSEVATLLSQNYAEVQHEVLVMTPARKRARPRGG